MNDVKIQTNSNINHIFYSVSLLDVENMDKILRSDVSELEIPIHQSCPLLYNGCGNILTNHTFYNKT